MIEDSDMAGAFWNLYGSGGGYSGGGGGYGSDISKQKSRNVLNSANKKL